MTMLIHRGYSAAIDYDDDRALFIARPAGLPDSQPIRAADMGALRRDFERAVDLHLEARESDALSRQWGGQTTVRIDRGVYAECALAAEAAGVDLALWVERTLRLTAEGLRTRRARPEAASV